MNINSLTASINSEKFKIFEDNINVMTEVSNFSGSILNPPEASISEVFTNISAKVPDNLFLANYNISESFSLSSEKLSPKITNIDIISQDNIQLNSSVFEALSIFLIMPL